MRHIGVTTMLAAARHDGAPGNYSAAEVARQFGNSPETLNRVYHHLPADPHRIAGKTMSEILHDVFRAVWGAMPGDSDYQEILLTTAEASALTGIAIGNIGDRARRGTLPATRVGNRYLISEFDLAWTGLLHPADRRSQPGLPADHYPELARGQRPGGGPISG